MHCVQYNVLFVIFIFLDWKEQKGLSYGLRSNLCMNIYIRITASSVVKYFICNIFVFRLKRIKEDLSAQIAAFEKKKQGAMAEILESEQIMGLYTLCIHCVYIGYIYDLYTYVTSTVYVWYVYKDYKYDICMIYTWLGIYILESE